MTVKRKVVEAAGEEEVKGGGERFEGVAIEGKRGKI